MNKAYLLYRKFLAVTLCWCLYITSMSAVYAQAPTPTPADGFANAYATPTANPISNSEAGGYEAGGALYLEKILEVILLLVIALLAATFFLWCSHRPASVMAFNLGAAAYIIQEVMAFTKMKGHKLGEVKISGNAREVTDDQKQQLQEMIDVYKKFEEAIEQKVKAQTMLQIGVTAASLIAFAEYFIVKAIIHPGCLGSLHACNVQNAAECKKEVAGGAPGPACQVKGTGMYEEATVMLADHPYVAFQSSEVGKALPGGGIAGEPSAVEYAESLTGDQAINTVFAPGTWCCPVNEDGDITEDAVGKFKSFQKDGDGFAKNAAGQFIGNVISGPAVEADKNGKTDTAAAHSEDFTCRKPSVCEELDTFSLANWVIMVCEPHKTRKIMGASVDSKWNIPSDKSPDELFASLQKKDFKKGVMSILDLFVSSSKVSHAFESGPPIEFVDSSASNALEEYERQLFYRPNHYQSPNLGDFKLAESLFYQAPLSATEIVLKQSEILGEGFLFNYAYAQPEGAVAAGVQPAGAQTASTREELANDYFRRSRGENATADVEVDEGKEGDPANFFAFIGIGAAVVAVIIGLFFTNSILIDQFIYKPQWRGVFFGGTAALSATVLMLTKNRLKKIQGHRKDLEKMMGELEELESKDNYKFDSDDIDMSRVQLSSRRGAARTGAIPLTVAVQAQEEAGVVCPAGKNANGTCKKAKTGRSFKRIDKNFGGLGFEFNDVGNDLNESLAASSRGDLAGANVATANLESKQGAIRSALKKLTNKIDNLPGGPKSQGTSIAKQIEGVRATLLNNAKESLRKRGFSNADLANALAPLSGEEKDESKGSGKTVADDSSFSTRKKGGKKRRRFGRKKFNFASKRDSIKGVHGKHAKVDNVDKAAALDEFEGVNDNQINKDTTVPIWNIISFRYIKSALPRLWEDRLKNQNSSAPLEEKKE